MACIAVQLQRGQARLADALSYTAPICHTHPTPLFAIVASPHSLRTPVPEPHKR